MAAFKIIVQHSSNVYFHNLDEVEASLLFRVPGQPVEQSELDFQCAPEEPILTGFDFANALISFRTYQSAEGSQSLLLVEIRNVSVPFPSVGKTLSCLWWPGLYAFLFLLTLLGWTGSRWTDGHHSESHG